MKKIIVLSGLLIGILYASCKEEADKLDIPSPKKPTSKTNGFDFTQEEYYDKVLGALVGSAIGDAMGASTEMWHRNEIQLKYGYITGLTPAVRDQSPEGTWDHNLVAGATTDDTRWKYFMVKYFTTHKGDLNSRNFSKFITDYYASLTTGLTDQQTVTDPDTLDVRMEKIDWIKEWARVAIAYQKGNDDFQKAQHRFYGGEMSCAGQLYTPMFGLISENPEVAYNVAYDHSLFDLGYAKDISGLVSAMTNTAMHTQDVDSILNTAVFIDPLQYQNSRLVTRISNNIANASRRTVLVSQEIKIGDSVNVEDSLGLKIPKGFPYSNQEWVQQDYVYSFLEKNEKSTAFHAGEIWEILVTALAFGQGDLKKRCNLL